MAERDAKKVAEGLTNNEKACLLAYTRSHDRGSLYANVYLGKGARIDAAYAADLIRVNECGLAIWEMRRDSLNNRAYRPTDFGLAVRDHLRGEQ